MESEPVTGEGARFACAACGALAAVVCLIPAGTAVDMGSPVGEQVHGRDGVMIDQWLGRSWHAVDPGRWRQVRDVLTADPPDPGALHAIGWELAPFWCRGCQRCYCTDHWQGIVIMDEGFYDCTEGVCPAGHRQLIDD